MNKLIVILGVISVALLSYLVYEVRALRAEHESIHYSIYGPVANLTKQISISDVIVPFDGEEVLSLAFTLNLEEEVDSSDYKLFLYKLEAQKTVHKFFKSIGYEESQKESIKQDLASLLFNHLKGIQSNVKIRSIKLETFIYI